jgi:hypothetical protein
VTLLSDLDGFYTEHCRCGDLDGGVDGPVVWIACDCGATVTPGGLSAGSTHVSTVGASPPNFPG